jgi:hypothetical protein
LISAAGFMAWSTSAIAADDLCSRLSSFESAQFGSTIGIPQPHWVEVHWRGAWLDFDGGWGPQCRHSSDPASVAFCTWLVDHTSMEFPDRLPRAILICHGYRFPDRSYWNNWKAEITLFRGDQLINLEIDQTGHRTDQRLDGAIRLSAFANGKDAATQPLPPIFAGPGAP